MFRPLRYILDQTITTGHLNLIDADGRNYGFGDHSGATVIARIADSRTERHLALNPTLALGEAYMDGRLIVEQGTIYDFFELLAGNVDGIAVPRWMRAIERLRFATRRFRQFNPRSFRANWDTANRALRGTVLPHVGMLFGHVRGGFSPPTPDGVPAPTGQGSARPAADSRLYV